jgi:hypothetical protein
MEGAPDARSAIERYRDVVTFISTAAFRKTIAESSKFESNGSALSKRLVFSTLRARAWNDNDIEIDLTAASAGDCRAAYRNIASQIERRHARQLAQNAKILEATIDDYRERSTQLQEWEYAELQAGSHAFADEDSAKTSTAAVWSETRERLLRLEAIKSQMTPTTFPAESDISINGPVSNNTARLSAIAGLALILSAIILTMGLETSPSKRSTQTNGLDE